MSVDLDLCWRSRLCRVTLPRAQMWVFLCTVVFLLNVHGYTNIESMSDVAGSGGEVYSATSPGGEEVVVKRPPSPAAAKREAEYTFAARGVGAVRMLLVDFTNGLIETARAACDLLTRVNAVGALSEAAAREVARVIITALARFHALGFAHNDIKPENILITSTDGGAVLADFGLAGPWDLVRYGTRSYWAPELVAANAAGIPDEERAGIDMRCCDMYSVGAAMYVALLGNASLDVSGAALGRLSPDCKTFLRALLSRDLAVRGAATAEAVLHMAWLAQN